MNFQQLRAVREAARRDFDLGEVALALQTSQPGIGRQIRELEQELRVPLFARKGKRLTGLTAPGERILPIVGRLLQHAERLRRAGADYQSEASGRLGIAATHSQARYALPKAVFAFRAAHPGVQLQLHQGSPQQVAQLLLDRQVDVAIATEALQGHPALRTLACHQWHHTVVVPLGHPLADGQPLTLARLAAFPIVSYEVGYTGRGGIDRAFSSAGLTPQFTLVAMDADVIKTYVRLGLGVGIIAAIAHQPERDTDLVALDSRALFAANTTRLAVRRDAPLREIVLAFIGAFAPQLNPETLQQALR
ncbi:LysR substrate-binding domain-containing protein [Ideonella sp.]|uniref:LysR substrate-binding domain-containing protein n=1 Tax=Ideonella sp. TaxID=1929293 RepID=UPI003BB694BF